MVKSNIKNVKNEDFWICSKFHTAMILLFSYLLHCAAISAAKSDQNMALPMYGTVFCFLSLSNKNNN